MVALIKLLVKIVKFLITLGKFGFLEPALSKLEGMLG